MVDGVDRTDLRPVADSTLHALVLVNVYEVLVLVVGYSCQGTKRDTLLASHTLVLVNFQVHIPPLSGFSNLPDQFGCTIRVESSAHAVLPQDPYGILEGGVPCPQSKAVYTTVYDRSSGLISSNCSKVVAPVKNFYTCPKKLK